MRFSHAAPLFLVVGGIALAAVACGSAKSRNQFDDTPKTEPTPGTGPITNGQVPCQGLECKRVACDDPTVHTTLTGKVYDPAGANPLYNVMVYIPAAPDADLPPIKDGVSCDTCGSTALNPMVSAITNEKGEFTLDNVPLDKDVPVVVQVGKWRRKLTIDITKKCDENKVPDRDFRLPKNGQEGDMPQIAVTSGGCDALECLLRGIGIDETEFVPGAATNGHIHVFAGSGGKGVSGSPAAGGTTADPFGGQLWNDAQKMAAYDMVMLSCECGETNENKGGTVAGARASMVDYAKMGGRIFATHYHYTWFKNSPDATWKQLANWGGGSFGGSDTYDVDQSFPKGQALAQWLMNVNASSSLGKIQLTDVTDSLSSANASMAQSWIAHGQNTDTRYFSFNAPIGAPEEQQCGRAVYSDLHLMGISAGGQQFPTGCPAPGGLSAQQKALEFMFFDLSSCVQSDSKPPVAPN